MTARTRKTRWISLALAIVMVLASGLCPCPMMVTGVAVAATVADDAALEQSTGEESHDCCAIVVTEVCQVPEESCHIPANVPAGELPTGCAQCCVVVARAVDTVKPESKTKIDAPDVSPLDAPAVYIASPTSHYGTAVVVRSPKPGGQTLLALHCALNC